MSIAKNQSKFARLMFFNVFIFREKITVVILSLTLTLISILDILGIVILAIAIADPTQYLNSKISEKLPFLSESLNFESESRTVILLALAILIFSSKTVIGILTIRKLFTFLGHKCSVAADEIFQKIFKQDLMSFQSRDASIYSYTLTSGLQALIIDNIGYMVLLVSELLSLLLILCVLVYLMPLVTLIVALYFIIAVATIQKFTSSRTSSQERIRSEGYISSLAQVGTLWDFYVEMRMQPFRVKNQDKFFADRNNEFKAIGNLQILGLLPKHLLEIVMLVGASITFLVTQLTLGKSEAILVLGIFIISASRILPATIRIQSALNQIARTNVTSKKTWNILTSLDSSVKENKGACSETVSFKNLVLTVTNMSFNYKGTSNDLFDSLSFTFNGFGLYSIVGPSGSGKTTLLNLLTGIVQPLSGTISVCGHLPQIYCDAHGEIIGYAPQRPKLLVDSILENVRLYDKTKLPNDVFQILQDLDLCESMNLKSISDLDKILDSKESLSGGQSLRLGLARLLIRDYKIIIVDEPTSALDSESSEIMLKILKTYSERAMVIVVTHSERIKLISDSVIQLGQFTSK